jgi:H+/Cl- antiporter ClcA
LTLLAFFVAAILTGVACVYFMWGFEFVLEHRLDFETIGVSAWFVTPALMLIAVTYIRNVASCAAGTGIPQAIFAAKHLTDETLGKLGPLLSPRTLVVKISALLIGLWVGASTGREGPTVHVAACVFFIILTLFRRWTGLKFDPRSAVIAGGAAGLAAAFNTPLAGVTFAIEELTVDYFGSIKDFVLVAIIIAALTAKFMTGEYTYFGRLMASPNVPLSVVSIIGVAGGVLGVLFSTALLKGQAFFARHQKNYERLLLPVVLSLGFLVVAHVFGTRVLGPGNESAQILVRGEFGSWAWSFPFAKMASTLLTYWSGLAGGIFAPCLSIGAAVGADIGFWMDASVATCAIVGMAAFLSGTIQAPITSFAIIFEMTGHHEMLLPIMLASLIGFMTSRLFQAKHLYQALAGNYQYLLDKA